MKLRSTLTVLGIGIGIGAILFLVSLGQGLQKLLIERITTSQALLTLDVSPPGGTLVVLNNATLDEISALPEVNALSPIKTEKAKIGFEGVTAGVTVNFVRPNIFRLSGLDKFFVSRKSLENNPQEEEKIFPSPKSIIASRAVLNLLAIKGDPIGERVSLAVSGEADNSIVEDEFTIVDTLDTDDSFVYVPLESYPEEQLQEYSSLKVQVRSTVVLGAVRDHILELGFIVSALSDTVRQANQVFTVMKIILAIFGIIALTVAAIGMFNTMTIALLERTQEIGIMRSIGASRIDIWIMFLLEAFMIGFLGGAAGVTFGIASAELANFGLNFLAGRLGGQPLDIFYYPMWFIVGVIIFSTMVAIITGFYPAQRAAHLNPLDALRYK
jgi:putative ABC transport system permease protein